MGLSYFEDVVNLELHPLELEIELVVPTLTSFDAVPQEFQIPVFNVGCSVWWFKSKIL